MKQLTDNIAFLLGVVLAVAMLLLYSTVFHAKVIAPEQESVQMQLAARVDAMETRLMLLTKAVGGRAQLEAQRNPLEASGAPDEALSGPQPELEQPPGIFEEPPAGQPDLSTRLGLLEERIDSVEHLEEAPPEVTRGDLEALRLALSLMEIKVDMAAGDYGNADARLDALKAGDLSTWPQIAERLNAMGSIKPETRARALLDLNLSLQEIVSRVGD